MADFRPSDVVLMPIPLTGTFGRMELECAAALPVAVRETALKALRAA